MNVMLLVFARTDSVRIRLARILVSVMRVLIWMKLVLCVSTLMNAKYPKIYVDEGDVLILMGHSDVVANMVSVMI